MNTLEKFIQLGLAQIIQYVDTTNVTYNYTYVCLGHPGQKKETPTWIVYREKRLKDGTFVAKSFPIFSTAGSCDQKFVAVEATVKAYTYQEG